MTDTITPSYANLSSISAGKAERAAELKVQKYSAIAATHDFQPIAYETLGPLNTSALTFLSSLGKRLSAATGDPREGAFLFQRLSVSHQRYSSVALHDSFGSADVTNQSELIH